MLIKTHDFSLSTSFPPDLTLSFAPTFNTNLVSSTITIFATSGVTNRIASVIINPYMTFYYGKAITIEDLISLKVYIKRTIWIGGILFNNIIEVWNYILKTPDNKRQVKMAKHFGNQFILLTKKMKDSYQTFIN